MAHSVRPRIIFISGTGTGIGKTVVSAILAEAMKADYWKPVQAGYEAGTDSEWIKNVVTNTETVIHDETYKLKLAASPHIAAIKENNAIELQKITSELPSIERMLIIEGAGGLMVPLNEEEFVADLITHLDLPVILVSRNQLGSINHSLLTAMACKLKGIRVIGWIFNDNYLDYENDIVRWTGIPKLANIPFHEQPDKSFVSSQALLIKKRMEEWQW